MDGNFGLVHKVSSGLGHGQHGSRHGDLFFKDHATIKEFISKYSSDRKNKTNVNISRPLNTSNINYIMTN